MAASPPAKPEATSAISRWRLAALVAGPLANLVVLALPPPEALMGPAWRVLGLALWMVLWWLSEALPLAVTALLPLIVLPLAGVVPQSEVAASYADPLIFLFLGGFFLAGALERWGLHRQVAYRILRRVGVRPARLVFGVMLSTALLSMWLSNTATAIVMYAVALSLLDALGGTFRDERSRRNFSVALLLGVAYSASIGGLASLLGTPPNLLAASFLEREGVRVDFARWLLVGLPLATLLLPLAWLCLVRLFPSPQKVAGALALPTPERLERPQWAVLAVFVLTASAWVLRPWLAAVSGLAISDTTIALAAAVLLFALPASLAEGRFLLDWTVAKGVAWEVLLLFGGGLALAAAFEQSGLSAAIAELSSRPHGLSPFLVVALLSAVVMVLGELTSNTASTATFLPVAGAVALGLGLSPAVLALPVALAASSNFMLPVATPPNALVFAHPDVGVRDMLRAGAVLDLLALILILGLGTWLVPLVFG